MDNKETKIQKDWTGSRVSVYRNLAGTGHSGHEREQHDFYATSPIATRLLLDIEEFDKNIWEPACGLKHISKCFEEKGHNVWNTDLVNRTGDIETMDFLSCDVKWHGDIVTNPPYKYATEFVQKALDCVEDGHKVAMFLKIQFLEGKKRKELFKVHPPKTVWVASSRLSCAINAQWEHPETECSGSAVCYCWFVWEKGFKGDTVVKWFN